MKYKWIIDSHKGSTFIFVLMMMAIYKQWENPTAWIYLALHGSYGILWVIKSQVFPDKQWERMMPLWWLGVGWGALSLYWIAPWLILSGGLQSPGWIMAASVGLFAFGLFFHFTSDMQKYTALALNPGQLIASGLWKHCRNPNYFGELLIYSSFALLSLHWAPFLVIAAFVAFFWLPNMHKKDQSLARYPDFDEYQRHSKLFIPFLY
jgi:protein-S-isoprenylcysteine O-methyltransferase Ste14